uniref:Conolysin-Mt1 n=1 Tax=Conus mustelinus TaxID=101309 RepID=CLY_CONMS|nr:RecName: Full=Conolysin-Mt1; AltName: Full=Moonwalker peptide; Contains: RecName: Full=Conolysin-Mt2 [Conus mustelinus]
FHPSLWVLIPQYIQLIRKILKSG